MFLAPLGALGARRKEGGSHWVKLHCRAQRPLRGRCPNADCSLPLQTPSLHCPLMEKRALWLIAYSTNSIHTHQSESWWKWQSGEWLQPFPHASCSCTSLLPCLKLDLFNCITSPEPQRWSLHEWRQMTKGMLVPSTQVSAGSSGWPAEHWEILTFKIPSPEARR